MPRGVVRAAAPSLSHPSIRPTVIISWHRNLFPFMLRMNGTSNIDTTRFQRAATVRLNGSRIDAKVDNAVAAALVREKGESQTLRGDLPAIGAPFRRQLRPTQREVTPMSEVSSRNALDETSFGVKQLLRKEAVELAARNERWAAIPPYSTLT